MNFGLSLNIETLIGWAFQRGGFIFGSFVYNYLRREKFYQDVDLFVPYREIPNLYFFSRDKGIPFTFQKSGKRIFVDQIPLNIVDYYSFNDDPCVDIELLKLDENGVGLRPFGKSKNSIPELSLEMILRNCSNKQFQVLPGRISEKKRTRIARLLEKGWTRCEQ